jgi:PAS domain S-box-containing protein
MATGKTPEDAAAGRIDADGTAGSAGVPASGELEGNAYNPVGNPGVRHWQAGYITRDGLHDRSNVFFAAIQMTRMPMAVTDPRQPDNPIVFVNRAFLDLTGHREQDVVGRNCRLLQGPKSDPSTIAEVRAAVAEKRAVAVDIVNYKADGTEFWNALFIGPVFDADGELLYWFSSQMDITRRRISEQSFLQAQKMEAVGQLTAGVAHDFNNLLQVIAGNLGLAAYHTDGNEALKEAIERANLATQKGAQLTQQLLAFARKQRLEPKRVNLNTLVVEFSEMLVRTLGGKIDLRLDLKPGLPACVIDPIHMEMALLNVLINARDAMPEGGIVTVGTSVISDRSQTEPHGLPAGTYVVLCAIDKGTGMSAEVRRQAIEPFFTTKRLGTGLGLAMVHGFAQQSHGRLELESEPGHGTTVKLIFPVASETASSPGVKNETQATGVRTILLVEDNDDVRHVAERYLRAMGFRVISAHSGEEALTQLAEVRNVDLLFTDIMMPGGMNGIELAERVRREHPEMPVLLCTGYVDELASRAGASAFPVLTKPYRESELAERLRQAFGNGGQPAAAFRHEG